MKSMFDITKDFNNLKYNVFASNKLSDCRGIERLGVNEIVRPDKLKLIRYAMVLYDAKSILVKNIQDVNQRKREAAVLAGYDLEKDSSVLEELFDMTDTDLQLIVINFLKDQNSFYWSMIVSNEQTFYEYQKALISEVKLMDKDKDRLQALAIKSKLMEDCDAITTRIIGYYTKVFRDDEIIEIVQNTRRYTPESMAKNRDV